MKSKIINSIGLALGIIGVFMLFKWGPPQPSFETGIGLGLEDNTPINSTGKTVAEHNREIKEKEQLYSRRSKQGLILIIIGFIFQFVAVWIDKITIDANAHNRKSNHNNSDNNPKEVLKASIANNSSPQETPEDDKRP
jgi:hypothetical protein